MLTIQNFEVLLDILLINLRCRILRFYQKKFKYAYGIEFLKFILKISNVFMVQNWGFIQQIRDMLTVQNFVVLPDNF